MKKLLSTTAILGAVAFTAGTAEAANLQVNVGGFIDFQAGYTSDDIVGENQGVSGGVGNANEINFNNDTEIHFTVEGTADNGLQYGAVIELEADVANTDNAQNGGVQSDKAYLFAQGGWGRVELGSNTDASEALSVNSATFASATGGVDGDFYRYAAVPAGFTGIIRPDLPIAHEGAASAAVLGSTNTNTDEDATKITYYSPRIAGFQAGVSYIPNSADAGTAAVTGTGYENVWTGGVNYTTQFDQVAVKAAVTGQTGSPKTKDLTAKSLKAWDAGVNVSFAGFTVGGSYGDWNHSAETSGNDEDGTYWDAGVGYAFGPWSASATYFSSEVESDVAALQDEFDNLVVGVDYKLAPGLVPYAEVSHFDFETGGAGTADNSGYVAIVGTQLTF